MSDCSDDSDVSRYLDHSDSESNRKSRSVKRIRKKEDDYTTFKVKKEHSSSLEKRSNSSLLKYSNDTQTLKLTSQSSHNPSNDTSSSSSSKRARLNKSSSSLDDLEDGRAEELELDQQKYPPQHKPGDSQDFNADQKRINYFKKVLAVKLDKYQDLNSFRPNSPSRNTPLALTLLGFCQHYWPGKVVCCGLLRENVMTLEKHLSRMHRSPSDPPNMLIIPENKKSKKQKTKKSRRHWDNVDRDNSQSNSDESGSESSDSVEPLNVSRSRSGCSSSSNIKTISKPLKVETLQQNRVSTSPSPKVSKNSIVARRPGPKSQTSLLAELKQDQLKYPPQHKPEESEDFNANEESLNYFRDVFKLKQEKYIKVTAVKDSPLSYSMSDFVNYYWPGSLTCCHLVHSTCKDFFDHFTVAHSSGQPLRLASAPSSSPLTADDLDSAILTDDDPPRPLSPVSKPLSPERTKNTNSITSSLRSIRPPPAVVVDISISPAKPVAKTVPSKDLKNNGPRPTSTVRSVKDTWSSSNIGRGRGTFKEPQNKRRHSKSPIYSVANHSPSPPSLSSSNARSPSPPPSNSRKLTQHKPSNNNKDLENLKSPTLSESQASFKSDFRLSPLLPNFTFPPARTSNSSQSHSQSPFPSPPDLWHSGMDPINFLSETASPAFSSSDLPTFEPISIERHSAGTTSPSVAQPQQQQRDDPSTSLFCGALCSMLSQLQPRERECIKRNIYNLVSDALLMSFPE